MGFPKVCIRGHIDGQDFKNMTISVPVSVLEKSKPAKPQKVSKTTNCITMCSEPNSVLPAQNNHTLLNTKQLVDQIFYQPEESICNNSYDNEMNLKR